MLSFLKPIIISSREDGSFPLKTAVALGYLLVVDQDVQKIGSRAAFWSSRASNQSRKGYKYFLLPPLFPTNHWSKVLLKTDGAKCAFSTC